MSSATGRSRTVSGTDALALLERNDCAFCADGTLVRERYRDNDAVVCDQCGTPAMQLWDPE
ncbi:HVO_A0556 family zinc finger protein [Halosolutus amylolyticus]|uniref:HVO_A0556 family zinc finger protein n=1 Tax=Halosolutus amylolyticus TaxID=2932267 RepID=A0ABD5PTK8_9EURY|nr:HVO_A0556 family zinc finger protein [Halosolutus amylolyticus]